MQEFYPFPILTQKSKDTKFKLIKTIEGKDYKYFKVFNENPLNKDSVFLYFDSKKYFLRKKERVSAHNTTIIEYYDFNEEEGIIFPFKEVSTMIIDGKEVQSSTTIINSIIINSITNISIKKGACFPVLFIIYVFQQWKTSSCIFDNFSTSW